MQEIRCAHVDLDGAWDAGALGLPVLDFTTWGPRLRFCALDREMEEFYAEVSPQLDGARFIIYGSGDFHHLSALWVRRAAGGQPLTLVSFDNHPDWDIRPPKWCCGSWINRALDLPQVEHIAVWGCGNFEPWGWHRIWGNHGCVRSGRLQVRPWGDGRSPKDQAKPHVILRQNWRDRFEKFAEGLTGRALYITVDLDGLRAEDAATDWENGRFTADEVAWALGVLARRATIVAGDLCGARSEPFYARRGQRFASETDHPELPPFDRVQTRKTNGRTFAAIWPVLTGARNRV